VAHDEPAGVKIGTLSCHERAGWGYLFGSSRPVRCSYEGFNHAGLYSGRMTNVGVDIGYHGPSDFVWAVFAPTTSVGPSALSGDYGGVTAAAAVGVGAGANVLIGGSGRSVTLQPVSISGGTGLAADGGIASLTLRERPS
jgi:hypothetical protein